MFLHDILPLIRFCFNIAIVHSPQKSLSVKQKLEKDLRFSLDPQKHSPTEEGQRGKTSRALLFKDIKNEAAEREMLVHLLKTSDAAVERKEALLKAIEAVSTRLEEYICSDGSSGGSLLSELKDHFAWLWATLEETNQTLNSTQRYIRLMYGNPAFCDDEHFSELNRSGLVKDALASALSPDNPVLEAARSWAVQLACDSENISACLVKVMAAENFTKKKKQSAEKSAAMKSRLRAVGQLLLSAACGQAMAVAPSGNDHVPPAAALAPGANKLFTLPETPAKYDATDLHLEVNAARDIAMADLKEAVNLLHTELAISNAQHKLHQ